MKSQIAMVREDEEERKIKEGEEGRKLLDNKQMESSQPTHCSSKSARPLPGCQFLLDHLKSPSQTSSEVAVPC